MLELRPNCELCDKNLAPDSPEARICTYECTFCADCVETVLNNVCPNCGGGFVARPIRPRGEYRPGVGLDKHPASSRRVHCKHERGNIEALVTRLASIEPQDR
jgi:hypothetical protein